MLPYLHTNLLKRVGTLLSTLTCRNPAGSTSQTNAFAYGRGKKVEETSGSQIWKEVDRSAILKQLEIVDYSGINQLADGGRQQLIHKIEYARQQLIVRVQEQITYVEQNSVKINKYLSKIHITAEILKAELMSIKSIIESYISTPNSTEIHELKAKGEILQGMLDFMLHRRHNDKIFSRLSYIIEVEIKLRVGILFFKQYNHSKDITNSPMKDYAAVWERIHIETTQNYTQIDKDYHSLSKIFHMMGGSIMKANKYKETLMEKVVFGFTLPLHMIKYEWSVLNSLLLVKNPTLENGKKFMNLYEEGVLKHITEMGYGKIQTNQMIYVPAEGEFADGVDIYKERKDAIPVRVLYYKDLPLVGKKSKEGDAGLVEDVFVHIHGGGFVGLSSQTTQNYTRKWANSLKMPIFSIDYRMPPEHPFPQAPNDCLQVYKFLTTQIHKYMNITPKNIYIGGDSAGGNITCAVTALILKQKLQKPNGLYVIYPSLDLRSIYYPSRKYILNDPLLWPSMIKLFLDSYVSKQEELAHPLASPLLLTEQYVNGTQGDKRFPLNWPLTYMTVGMKDPLRDDTLILMQRMTESNIDCKCYVFSHLRHGYMSTEALVKESKVAVNHSLDSLKEMIAQSKLSR